VSLAGSDQPAAGGRDRLPARKSQSLERTSGKETTAIHFCEHYHRERNHQGLENNIINPEFGSLEAGVVNCRERLGGLLRYYYRDAA
jgi:hypothetical protein